MGPWSPPAHSAVKPISEYLKKTGDKNTGATRVCTARRRPEEEDTGSLTDSARYLCKLNKTITGYIHGGYRKCTLP